MPAKATAPNPSAASGSKLLEVLNFDHRLAAAVIAVQDEDLAKELLDSIIVVRLRKNVACSVFGIRDALGLEADFARDIYQGTE
jgi:hypothetical protein